MLGFVDGRGIERRVVEQDFDAIGSGGDDAPDRIMIEQIGQTAGLRIVVAALFVSQQQAGILGADFSGGKAVLGIEQNGAGMRRQDACDGFFEFGHHLVGDGFFVDALILGDGAF